MYAHRIALGGLSLAVWDFVFLCGVTAGYFVLRATLRVAGFQRPRALAVRWLVTVYVSVVGAQLFAYAFDVNASLLPPASTSWLRYYLDPLGGPKTLYGAIVALPLGVAAATLPWRDVPYRSALDCWTPPLMSVLAVARLGCFLQGCCYGVRSDWFGMSFPAGSPAYQAQVRAGEIVAGAASHPVVPTQALSFIVLLLLAVWCYGRVREARRHVFFDGIALYSVARFGIEIVRADPERNAYGPFSTSQWIAIGILGAYVLGRLSEWGASAPTRSGFRR